LPKRDPFFQSCKHDPIPLPRQASSSRSGGEVGADDGELSLDRDVSDADRFFRDKDLEELTRKTYDNMGLEVRDVLAKSDLYEICPYGRPIVKRMKLADLLRDFGRL
jgi:hypothetical protein